MKPILILFLFLTTNLFAQDTKKVKSEAEVYYVLKSDKKIKHGEYLRYYWNREVIGEKGLYDMNNRVGIWEFYDFKGKLEQKYNYSDKKIEIIKPSPVSFKMWTEINGTYEDRVPDEVPIFIGGQSRFIYFLMQVKYTADAMRYGVEGKVFISAIITKDGQLIDEKVETGIGRGCDQEALKTIKNIPDEWIPGKVNGETTNVRVLIPITFQSAGVIQQ